MCTSTRLKVMALGDALTIARLNTCIDTADVDLIGLSRIPEAIKHIKQEKFDVILIDSLLEEAGTACQSIYEMACVPVALLVRETEANWQKLGFWEVDGFVREESTRSELVARIKAVSRRRIKRLAVSPSSDFSYQFRAQENQLAAYPEANL
jgi:DNA-binding response OmpR family regulator